jgi:hypothetical protein
MNPGSEGEVNPGCVTRFFGYFSEMEPVSNVGFDATRSPKAGQLLRHIKSE